MRRAEKLELIGKNRPCSLCPEVSRGASFVHTRLLRNLLVQAMHRGGINADELRTAEQYCKTLEHELEELSAGGEPRANTQN